MGVGDLIAVSFLIDHIVCSIHRHREILKVVSSLIDLILI